MNVSPTLSVRERILGGLWGSLVGDALGVPVEFKERATVLADPVKDMRGFGSHNQPPGTWSDDGALTLCTVDSLLHTEFDTQDMGMRFVRWMNEEYWTATGVVFDVGGATADALMQIASGTLAERAGGCDEYSNGNGSLMRIRFRRILEDELVTLPEGEIVSTGYALHTLHASLWSFLTTSRFEECVLKAVNLGGDTDTTGCVSGGLAGVHYGLSAIPQKWLQSLARHDEVESLFNRFAEMICSRT